VTSSCRELSTIGLVKVVAGLGNPGERYRLTRHNVGFRVVDLLADRWGLTGQGRVRDGAARLEVDLHDPEERVLLVKPMKFMNLSGAPVKASLRQTEADPSHDLLVVTDDVDLPLGRLRLRREGSAGGHNGLRDIIAALATNGFNRLRVGIGRSGTSRATVDHVLSTFKPVERELAGASIGAAADAVELWVRDGIEAAMNEFNGLDLAESDATDLAR
jgi:PTH1 family peptidyl-tRNA hydrolase